MPNKTKQASLVTLSSLAVLAEGVRVLLSLCIHSALFVRSSLNYHCLVSQRKIYVEQSSIGFGYMVNIARGANNCDAYPMHCTVTKSTCL